MVRAHGHFAGILHQVRECMLDFKSCKIWVWQSCGQLSRKTSRSRASVPFGTGKSKMAWTLAFSFWVCVATILLSASWALLVVPLADLSSPANTFVWTSGCQESFDSAKARLCSAPVVAAADFACAFKLELDASSYGAGAALLQEVAHPVCCFSKKFNTHQKNCSTNEKETLALLLALQHFLSPMRNNIRASCIGPYCCKILTLIFIII